MSTASKIPDEKAGFGTQKSFFGHQDFVERYKRAEFITASYVNDLLKQSKIVEYEGPINFLDLACGMGTVTKMAVQNLHEARSASQALFDDHFTCVDIAPLMLDIMKSRIQSEGWPVAEEQINIVQTDMKDTKLPSDSYTHIMCNFGPCVTSKPEQVLQECCRMLQHGGVAGWSQFSNLVWHSSYARAFSDLESVASEHCANNEADEDDRILVRLPQLKSNAELLNSFVGVDLREMRAGGMQEELLPRRDQEVFFKSQIEKAGFHDVEVTTVPKDFDISLDFALETIDLTITILRAHWTHEERELFANVDLRGKLAEWWRKRFAEQDVVNDVVVWKDCLAMIATGRKV